MANPTPESEHDYLSDSTSESDYSSDSTASDVEEEEERRYIEQVEGFEIESSYGSHLCGCGSELVRLALFAVNEHNKKENAHLEFVRVVKASMGLVAGSMYYITLEAIEAGMKNKYQAKVWDGIGKTTLELFRLANDAPPQN